MPVPKSTHHHFAISVFDPSTSSSCFPHIMICAYFATLLLVQSQYCRMLAPSESVSRLSVSRRSHHGPERNSLRSRTSRSQAFQRQISWLGPLLGSSLHPEYYLLSVRGCGQKEAHSPRPTIYFLIMRTVRGDLGSCSTPCKFSLPFFLVVSVFTDILARVPGISCW